MLDRLEELHKVAKDEGTPIEINEPLLFGASDDPEAPSDRELIVDFIYLTKEVQEDLVKMERNNY